MASAAAIANQIDRNMGELAGQRDLLVMTPKTNAIYRIIQSRIRILNNANFQWNLKYKKLTGKPYFRHVHMAPLHVTSDIVRQQREARQQEQNFKRALKDSASKLEKEVQILEGRLKHIYKENNTSFAAGFVHFFSSAYYMEPEWIRKQCVVKAKIAIKKGRSCLSVGDTGGARAHFQAAINHTTEGLGRFQTYMSQIHQGGDNTIKAIKTIKTIATAIATGGVSIGVEVVSEAVSTGSEEATTLILKATSDKHNVSKKDIFDAGKNVAIDSATKLVSGKLGDKVGKRLLNKFGTKLTKESAKKISDVVTEYTAANFKQIAKDVEDVAGGKEVKAKLIARLLLPAVKSSPLPGGEFVGDVLSDTEILQAITSATAGQ